MFGYINVNREKLEPADRSMYQSYYCGLCQKLKENYGRKGQMLLNYDMTFLIVLLTGLYELEDHKTEFICAMHPSKKQTARINEATSYAAAMNILLCSKNFEDDWNDNHSYTKKALSQMFKKDYDCISKEYPRQSQALNQYLKRLEAAEKDRERNVDAVAGLTGEMLGEIFAWKEGDIWAEELRCMGFYMGKFIYLMDAYEDLEEDAKSGGYNPLLPLRENDGFEDQCRQILTMMLAQACQAFERLPLADHVTILRNILYSGIWCRYELTNQKRKDSQNHV